MAGLAQVGQLLHAIFKPWFPLLPRAVADADPAYSLLPLTHAGDEWEAGPCAPPQFAERPADELRDELPNYDSGGRPAALVHPAPGSSGCLTAWTEGALSARSPAFFSPSATSSR